ncbi:hypothetical protein CspeluHIS016_0111200 [Cutaneotrichosporon spelunceum]|uniref:Transcription initiation factor TFIID subunit 4 n=1 Tax=Cutaneotrichosporon spelunceum TaxID=1672016 RepID=A0AAD3YAB0_9TREE|nr:hypothetical protein CspeluHIS016_0111200 [Cutaneotrichosporon spelunceum]
MSVPWSGTVTESVLPLAPAPVVQTDALSLPSPQPPSISPAAVQPETKPMSNGLIGSGAQAAAAPPRPAVPAPVVNLNGKRELSSGPQGQPPQKTIKASHVVAGNAPAQAPPPHGPAGIPIPRPPPPTMLPMGRGQGIDLRAEEEAARRAARSAVGGARFAGSGSRAKHTDLLGEQVLRARLNRLAHEHGMVFDDEAMRLLAMGAETRMRSLIESATRAQQHRVHSTHQRRPPMRTNGNKGLKPLWSQRITSDTGAVMAALASANKEENKAHRVARTERNARETELARAMAAAKEREARESGSAPDTGAASPAGGAPPEEAATGPARPRPSEPVFQASPTFGGTPPPRKSKGKKAGGRDMSAEVQAKMANQTATVNAGRKRYAWEMGGGFRPQVSSLLSGKRKKAEEEEKKEKEEEVEAPPPPKKKRTVSAPHRRLLDVDVRGDKRARDDTALTVVDVMFALEREGSGRGMGTSEEIVRRQYAKAGGPYGPWQ